ncbi:MAG: penicillin-binding transpeptidase domain-containing protein [Oscillospiraceae bacterium]|nr:penicillin-binding transpeptidase domain-containing protein [Oscillospiraceae bacterium]
MKKVKNRALCALLIVGLMVLGLSVYIIRFALNGDDWVSAAFNSTVYNGGVLSVGTLTDRNGVVLAGITDGSRTFAENADVRRATLHAVGDRLGNIGTGALTVFAPRLIGYNIVTGAASLTGQGRTVALSIDSRLNVEAYRALNGRRGAVMVMNYQTGEVLAMVSSPTFDPANQPVITDDDPAFEGVFINRTIQAAYTPGSTFKLLTAAAAIESIAGIETRVFECTGSHTVQGGTITCPRAHGGVTLDQAMAVSCNITFGMLAIELGGDTLAAYTERYGLSGRITVSGITTAQGNFEVAAPGTADLAWSGIGQFTNTVNPAAMLRYIAAIANDGVAVEMNLLEGARTHTRRIMPSAMATRLGETMDHHTDANFPGLRMHAKSGTAEVGGDQRPHAWFAGYITNEGFPFAFVVVIENAGGGLAQAGPVANRVLQAAVRGH